MAICKRGRIWWIDCYHQHRNHVQESAQTTRLEEAKDLLAIRRAAVVGVTFRLPSKLTAAKVLTPAVTTS
jgi:hypothetical protein